MADLNDRGQIILIAGFALAVIFVALALIVNSAIFTENLATRGETTGGSDALIERHQMEVNVGTIIGSVNDDTTATPLNETNQSVANMTLQGGIQNAERGRIVTADVVGDSEYLNGHIYQENGSREYVTATGTPDWVVADDADRIRNAEFNISTDSLANVSKGGRISAFNFVITDGSDEWRMAVYEPQETNAYDANITVDDPGGGTDTFSTSGDFVLINVTDETVGGAAFAELGDYSSLSSNRTQFENGVEANGTYNISLEGVEGIAADNFNASASPVADVDIEYLDLRYVYSSVRAQYETTFTVEPEGS